MDGYDYGKIYVDDVSYHEGHGKIYETFKIAQEGCAVILRPDQYVSYVGPLEDVGALNRFFAGFLMEQDGAKGGGNLDNGIGGDLADGGPVKGSVKSAGIAHTSSDGLPM